MSNSRAIIEWKERRSKVVEESKLLLKNIAKQNKSGINAIANKLHVEVFKEVDCLDCANCCKSIPPLINQEDVKRISKYLNIPISDLYKNHVTIDEDGDMVLNTTPCIFLLPDNKCKIYEVRPTGCREYPLTDQNLFADNMDQHAMNAYYCPAVFHVLERLKKIQ